MKGFKKFSLMIFSAVIFVCFALVFAGCKDDDNITKLYVFSTIGGKVQVNDNVEYVEFGDEGSKVFSFEEESTVTLKAIADSGYRFVKWQFTDRLKDKYQDVAYQAELKLLLEDDEVVLKAIFETDGSVATYNVTYPTETTGYSIMLETGYTSTVLANSDFKFRVALWQDYSNSDLVVKVNGEIITHDDKGLYSISNINQNMVITIEGVKLNEVEENPTPEPTIYGVFTQDSRFSIIPVGQDTCQVESGNSFTFAIELKDGYKYGASVVVKAGGVVLTANNGNYTIQSVTKNTQIVVDGIEVDAPLVEPTMYDIFTNDTTYTIQPVGQDTFEVESGSSFTFKIVIKDGYKASDDLVVKANNIELTEDGDGKYTITAVTEDVEISVQGIVEDKQEIEPVYYTISTTDTRFTIMPKGTNSLQVAEGDSFVFEIVVNNGYKIDGMLIVYANDMLLIVNNGVYTIEAVTENTQITVEGIVEDKQEEVEPTYHTISTPTDALFTIQPVNQTGLEVLEGNAFTFTIQIIDSEKYEFSDSVIVKVGDDVITANGAGQYTIYNVISDIVITVEGIVEKTPEIIPTTYTFALDFEEGIKEVMPEIVDVISATISFDIVESEKQDSYKASEFMVIDNNQHEMSIQDIIDLVNEAYSLGYVSQFTIGGVEFIGIDGDNITINWDLLTLIDETYPLIIQIA